MTTYSSCETNTFVFILLGFNNLQVLNQITKSIRIKQSRTFFAYSGNAIHSRHPITLRNCLSSFLRIPYVFRIACLDK